MEDIVSIYELIYTVFQFIDSKVVHVMSFIYDLICIMKKKKKPQPFKGYKLIVKNHEWPLG